MFITAGFPHRDSTVPLALAIAGAGADIIELGIPFSDPVADGPVIQSSSDVALRNGTDVAGVIAAAAAIRERSGIPIVLMGYTNPVLSYGLEKFFHDCAAAGVDGTILADSPPEESTEYRNCASSHDICTVFLAAPTTSDLRCEAIDRLSTGFVYCVSITGITGRSGGIGPDAVNFVKRARAHVTKNPLLVGFGISTPADARMMGTYSDGVIVGSALIRAISAGHADPAAAGAALTASMRSALDSHSTDV
jgi:tryptophan synthase alpha chain